ncbi:unnamed protein product [Symbiodinium sp. CCMP2456]|nr:unnamed protein product [Symbiodinium sp. CCMP2456]
MLFDEWCGDDRRARELIRVFVQTYKGQADCSYLTPEDALRNAAAFRVAGEPGVIRADLQEILRVLPAGVIARLRSHPLCIWVNLDNGVCKKGCCCHHVDLPDEYMKCKSNSVEIFDIRDYLQQTKVQPAQLLHEISHWVHFDIVRKECSASQSSKWRSSSGRIIMPENQCILKETSDVGPIYSICGFGNACLNGRYVLDASSLGSAGSPRLIKIQDGRDVTEVACRCTDRTSARDTPAPDRWHLEVGGQALAYRIGTDFGARVSGWYEWLNEAWCPTTACATAVLSNEAATAHVEGFSERALNGLFVELETLQSVYVRKCTEAEFSQRQRTARTWLKTAASGPDFTLRFTNRRGDIAERTTALPFDRWHIESGSDCRAYLCQADPCRGTWHELYSSPTDEAYASGLRV